MFGISTGGWLVPALVGAGIGYLLSPTIAKFLPIHPFQAMAATHVPMRRPTVSRPSTVHSAPMIKAAAPATHYVPVRRSFDRSYDSWLHQTVNSLPAIG